MQQWQPKCKCKGTMKYAHEECLLQWMKQSDSTQCPQCNHTYELTTTYPSVVHKVLAHKRVPTVLAFAVLLALYMGFHVAFTRLKARFIGKPSPRGHSAGGGWASMYSSSRLTAVATELELFALVLTVLYTGARWVLRRQQLLTEFIEMVDSYAVEQLGDGGYTDASMHSYDIFTVAFKSLKHVFAELQDAKVQKKTKIHPYIASAV